MILTAFILVFIALWLVEDDGKLSAKKHLRCLALVSLIVSLIIFAQEHGLLRGSIIFIAAISLLGTLLTVLKGSVQKNIE